MERDRWLFFLFHFLHLPLTDKRPKRVDHHPANAGSNCDRRQTHFPDEQPREHHAQRDMARRAEKRDGNPADTVKITCKRVSGKAERIENRDDFHVGARIFEGRAAALAEHEPDGRGRAHVHDRRHRKTHADHQRKTSAKGLPHALLLPCPEVLRHENRRRGASAVAERVREAFDARSRGVGRNHLHAAGIDRALHEQLSDVEAGLMERGDEAEMRGSAQKHAVHPAVRPGENQLGRFPPQIENAQQRRKRLRAGRGPRRPGNAPVQLCDEQAVKYEIDAGRQPHGCGA